MYCTCGFHRLKSLSFSVLFMLFLRFWNIIVSILWWMKVTGAYSMFTFTLLWYHYVCVLLILCALFVCLLLQYSNISLCLICILSLHFRSFFLCSMYSALTRHCALLWNNVLSFDSPLTRYCTVWLLIHVVYIECPFFPTIGTWRQHQSLQICVLNDSRILATVCPATHISEYMYHVCSVQVCCHHYKLLSISHPWNTTYPYGVPIHRQLHLSVVFLTVTTKSKMLEMHSIICISYHIYDLAWLPVL